MFSSIAKEEWVYEECVVIPDYASDRVGAVLFQDNTRGTSDVAFFDSEGYFQQCGTHAELADKPNFTYVWKTNFDSCIWKSNFRSKPLRDGS